MTHRRAWSRLAVVLTVALAGVPMVGSAGPARATPPRSFSIAGVGDVLIEASVWKSAAAFAKGSGQRYDFRPMFGPTKSIISGVDLAICHMETPIGKPGATPGRHGTTPFGGNRLLAPYEIAPAIRDAGFDRCSTASNHSYDLFDRGITDTLDILDSFGIEHTGTARGPAEARPDVETVNGVRVGHLSWSRRRNWPLPKDDWRFNFASIPKIVAEVQRLRDAGAEVVILSLHQGTELLQRPTAEQRTWMDQLLAATHIDVVISHHAHVIQPVEWVKGTLVFWGVGNFISGMGPGRDRYWSKNTLDGILARVDFTETSPGVFAATPHPIAICSEMTTRVVYPVVAGLADSSTPSAVRTQLAACLARIRKVVPSAE